MKKLYWVIAICIATIILGIVFGVVGTLLIPAACLIISFIVLAGCRGGRIPKSVVTTVLLVLSALWLVFVLSFGISRMRFKSNKVEPTITDETIVESISISKEEGPIEIGEKVNITVMAEGVKVDYLTSCDLKTDGGEFQIIDNEKTDDGSELLLQLTEVTEDSEQVELYIEKDGIKSNTIVFDVLHEEEPESQNAAEETFNQEPIVVTKEVVKEVKVPVEKEVIKEVKVPVEKEVIKEVKVPVEKEPEPTKAPEPEPVKEIATVPSQQPIYNYGYGYGDPTQGYNHSGYGYGYGDPTNNNYNSGYTNSNVRISGPTSVTAGETETYTISGVSSFSISKLEYPEKIVTVRKKSNNSFTLTFDDDYTGNVYLDYNDLELDFRIRVSE